jgi:ribosome recycling factor
MPNLENHTYAGITFPGRPAVGEILKELERQKEKRKDIVIRSDKLEAKILDGQFLFAIQGPKEKYLVPMTRRVENQLASWMGLPMRSRYYQWLSLGAHTPDAKQTPQQTASHWAFWRDNINDFLHTEKSHRLVRLMDTAKGETYWRALLSDAYKPLLNADFFYAVTGRLQEAGAEIWHARLSEDKFYGYAVAPGIAAQVSTDRSFDPGDGWTSRWYGKEGDTFNAALAFGNSETGEGGIFIKQAILRRVCVNYCVWHDVVNKAHIGKRRKDEAVLSDETMLKMNEVFLLQIRDYVKATFDPERFQLVLESINGSTKDVIEDADKATEAMALVFPGITEERRRQIRNLFIKEGDTSRYGLAQALTAVAHASDMEPDTGFAFEETAKELFETSMEKLEERAEKIRKERKEKVSTKVLEPVTADMDL